MATTTTTSASTTSSLYDQVYLLLIAFLSRYLYSYSLLLGAISSNAPVEVYDLRPDLRDPNVVPLNFTNSINLAVSERGINAMRQANQPDLLNSVMETTIPMRGRMIHGQHPSGALYEQPQDYDIQGRTIFAIDRTGLNTRLLDALESMPNVKLFFNHKLTGADFRACKAWFEDRSGGLLPSGRPREVEKSFDLMIGADGAHSAVRYHMMKFTRMNYSHEYIDTLWCQFNIAPLEPVNGAGQESRHPRFRISPNHLHIWPGKEFMFIAIPSDDGSFTCTLFMPGEPFAELERNPSNLPAFFDTHFPGVTSLIPAEDLIKSFTANPHLPLISLKCMPYHYSSTGVIVGDAAHAMVPFYGQGMNAGLEDVRILFGIFDKHATMGESNDPDYPTGDKELAASLQRARALAEYSAVRAPDAHAINDLALKNYEEMRASVLSKRYRLRKFLEEFMSVHFPSFGWQTKYSRVSFSNERYSEIVRRMWLFDVAHFEMWLLPAIPAIRSLSNSSLSFAAAAAEMPSILNIAHMCSHLQNASKAKLGITSVASTKYNLHLALALHRAGFFSAVYRAGASPPPTLEQMASQPPEVVTTANVAGMRLWLGLKYWGGKPVLARASMVSTPSRLMTAQIRELDRLAKGFPTKFKGGVVQGLNVGECLFVATSRGVLEAREALDKKVGGLLMCRVS
ncbi:Kynurenine 3-monooxygenase [Escovopsis weberi]|uniref:Kynurenine 3-monooxygenase n=1 Tax=Escovopsis weberi TaxID=150374 RepID=A0A0M9VXP4_ESCWE|nr:Kynurenine 3-monooxygenase [Escovopsis weberi]